MFKYWKYYVVQYNLCHSQICCGWDVQFARVRTITPVRIKRRWSERLSWRNFARNAKSEPPTKKLAWPGSRSSSDFVEKKLELRYPAMPEGSLGKWYTGGLQNRIRGFDSLSSRKYKNRQLAVFIFGVVIIEGNYSDSIFTFTGI